MFADGVQGFGAINRFADNVRIRITLQHFTQDVAREGLVINEQNTNLGRVAHGMCSQGAATFQGSLILLTPQPLDFWQKT